jgi:hypothetical protein
VGQDDPGRQYQGRLTQQISVHGSHVEHPSELRDDAVRAI